MRAFFGGINSPKRVGPFITSNVEDTISFVLLNETISFNAHLQPPGSRLDFSFGATISTDLECLWLARQKNATSDRIILEVTKAVLYSFIHGSSVPLIHLALQAHA
ncbi:hypothetical protein [uncultured Agrobacterium sp.]|uniref:hypothetical protein n=1 Tax=uncultured Agrobacterium sp. TaxID=157277 RepID=UPI0025ED41A8|nr:hypothetical protein [uncultured Agrobacterium sp.]